nr:DAK2 domain-containing protein [Planosporangium thailandense]
MERLRQHQHEIDALNVYPVPDGDTGTNLVLTVAAGYTALADADGAAALSGALDGATASAAPLGRILRSLARGALLGARGNSGVILSQMFGGMAESLAQASDAGGRALAAALDRAAVSARAAVSEPVEGTILTVARAAADAALAVDGDDVVAVARAARESAREALARTPQQLPALARAGVVDAGGRGLVVLLDALVEVVTGGARPDPGAADTVPAPPMAPARTAAQRETGSGEYDYEVQYLLDAPAEAVDRLRHVLGRLGDSVVVVGAPAGETTDRTWNVHVHVNDVGAAIEAGIEAGRPYRISVLRFDDQMRPDGMRHDGMRHDGMRHDEMRPDGMRHDEMRKAPAPAPTPVAAVDMAAEVDAVLPVPLIDPVGPADERPPQSGRAVVVVCDGDGSAELFAAEGATVVRRHPDGAAPSTGEILDTIRATGAGSVVVMPNDPNVIAAATAAAEEARAEGIRAGVVPTRSPVQALAALAVRDPDRRFEDDIIAMAESAGACRYAEVTTASRDALTVAGLCRRGDVLALVQGEVTLIGQDLVDTCRRLLDRLLAAGGEMVTLLTGDRVPEDLVGILTEHVGREWPFVEVHCYRGGQPHYPLLVGVE